MTGHDDQTSLRPQFDLDRDDAYQRWREEKLATYPRDAGELHVDVRDVCNPAPAELDAAVSLCRRTNMTIIRCGSDHASKEHAEKHARAGILRLAGALGVFGDERHRSADADGIVAIEATDTGGKRGFIPYSRKAMNWHTDGYYNAPGQAIRSMILHCVRPAREGGATALLDPEIVYIRLRDSGPSLLTAMMHPRAMTIPESIEEDGSVRAASTGPVFFIDDGGALVMRYTARTRSIAWREDEDTRAGLRLLERLLVHEEEPLILRTRLEAGDGLVCNNVLHARTAFMDGEDTAGRLLLRARYHKRVAGT